jgi:hypothetical protein
LNVCSAGALNISPADALFACAISTPKSRRFNVKDGWSKDSPPFDDGKEFIDIADVMINALRGELRRRAE